MTTHRPAPGPIKAAKRSNTQPPDPVAPAVVVGTFHSVLKRLRAGTLDKHLVPLKTTDAVETGEVLRAFEKE